ncbi:hypothetical protein [Moraxella sp. VT-16-12]|uniref:hypothetical protein n=1 Tax=Moraxella sp. VT-16-12 TaxID=2014877 RepID=UPI000B802656|nr:hypothetical protein [Moraxella sp. VT-16-12]TWV80924.1 hypothetical protein CEW93_008975 [Moraxella sp. VT-16-12]
MKLLFVGFSEQNANLLSFLIEQHFTNIQCVYIERDLTSDLRFALPNIPSQHQDAQGLIINLGGIGMLSYQHQHKAALLNFTQNRPTLLTTRTPIDVWQEALTEFGHYIYIQSPYSKDTILPVLQQLIDKGELFSPLADTIQHSNDEILDDISVATTPAPIPTPKPKETDRKQPLSDNTLLQKPNNKEQSILDAVLGEHFKDIYYLPMVRQLCQLFWQDEPFLLKTSRYEALIDPTRNLLISTNVARIIDYLTIAKSHDEFANSITVEPLDTATYQEHTDRLQEHDAKKYALNTLIWQMYQAILPEEINTTAHNLQIKLKFMPNLNDIEDLPSYTQAVMASCLSTPKTLSDIYTLFSEAHTGKLNRLCLLAIISKTVDLDSLQLVSPQHVSGFIPETAPKKNDGVAKATKTGFFKRLLRKLAF